MYKVYVTDSRHASYEIEKGILAEIGAELIQLNCVTDEDIAQKCADADGILLDMAPMTAKAIATLENCKVINRYGVGYDNVDVDAATEKGIQVTFVPDYCAEDVSDHALSLMLACCRDIPRRDRLIRQGEWNIRRTSYRLQGKVLGLLGFGRIARALARKCAGFGFRKIMCYDPYVTAEAAAAAGVEKAELREVLEQSDFVSLHMPVTRETTHMINRETLSWMKPSCILVNASRGLLVDDAALAEALSENRLLAAGLDTHTKEPIDPNSPFLSMKNVILTDHTAYSTEEGIVELKIKSARNIVRALTGEAPVYPVNKLN